MDISASTGCDDRQTPAACSRFQVLCLDGGGAKGLFSATVLAQFEEDNGIRITDHFDLIAGTSTGGIIALALAAGLSPQEIVDHYTSLIDAVFPASRRRMKIWQLVHSKYGSDNLRLALVGILGDKTLFDSIKPLVIPTWDLQNNEVHIFKTRHHDRLRRDYRVPMVDVAMATSAAPTFFPAAQVDKQRLIDGGVWANDPSVVGITEAVSTFGVPLSAIRMLSIGTTEEMATNPKRLDCGGLIQWAPRFISLMMDATASGGQSIARHLIGDENYLRVNVTVPKGTYSMDAVDQAALTGNASSVSRNFGPQFMSMFGGHNVAPFIPIPPPEGRP